MSFDAWPQTAEMREAFSEELCDAGGKVIDTFDDGGGQIYVRGTLPNLRELRPGDRVQAGVAMRGTDTDIRVHPYVFRLVCSNGAIRAEAVQTRVIEVDDPVRGEVMASLREAVRDCCCAEAFDQSARAMRGAMEREADTVLSLMPLMSRLPRDVVGKLLTQILGEFRRGGDRSRYGLMNAVTATARQQKRDPELRWRLEELGGAIPAMLESKPRAREQTRDRRAPREALVSA